MHLCSPLRRVTLLSFWWCMMASFCELSMLRDNKFKNLHARPCCKIEAGAPNLDNIQWHSNTCLDGDFLPTITTPVDNTSLTFKVFLMNDWLWQSHYSCVSVYKSSTGAWRDCQIHQRGMGLANSQECLKHRPSSSKGFLHSILAFWEPSCSWFQLQCWKKFMEGSACGT